MNAQRLFDSLARFGDVLSAVVHSVDSAEVRWRPAVGAWSILEIVAHLADEETEDFRRRLESTLTDPSEPWQPNDPEAWAVERRYNDGDIVETLARFTEARTASVVWLGGLEGPAWSNAYNHPQWGPIRAGDILVSWAAHDWLHLRQVTKRIFQMTKCEGTPFTTDYAGSWTA